MSTSYLLEPTKTKALLRPILFTSKTAGKFFQLKPAERCEIPFTIFHIIDSILLMLKKYNLESSKRS